MDTPDKSGSTRRAQLLHVEKAKGETPKALLDAPEIPFSVQHIWDWFWQLHSARGNSGMGVSPIGYTEISAWAKMTGAGPTPWEVAALRALDQVYLKWINKRTENNKAAKK